ncbi:MAG: hypothetical protein JNL82_02685 [Myxococcales bacterium]|nr:hypothetical protein [Myxococcales bacterium]
MTVPRRPNVRRLAWTSAGLLGGFTLLAGAMHLPSVQRAMGWMDADGQVACPFGHGAAAPRAPRVLDDSLPAAAARPALGFTLDATTRADLEAWAAANAVACAPSPRNPRQVTCDAVPAGALASRLDATAAWFEFGESGTLAGVKTTRRAATSAPVADEYRAAAELVTRSAGTPSVTRDEHLASLDRGAFHQASREYKFRDYRAVLRATNMGDGFLLTEQYASNLQ